MHELVQMLTQKLGVSQDQARKATSGVLQLMHRKMGDAEFKNVLSKIPGAAEMAGGGEGGGGKGAGLLGKLLGGGGGDGGGLPKILTESGIGADKLEPFMNTFMDYLRSKGGDGLVQQVMGHFPKLQKRMG